MSVESSLRNLVSGLSPAMTSKLLERMINCVFAEFSAADDDIRRIEAGHRIEIANGHSSPDEATPALDELRGWRDAANRLYTQLTTSKRTLEQECSAKSR